MFQTIEMENQEPRRAKRNHFVAQVYLRQFSTAANPRQIWLFDKETGERALTALENGAVRADYYAEQRRLARTTT